MARWCMSGREEERVRVRAAGEGMGQERWAVAPTTEGRRRDWKCSRNPGLGEGNRGINGGARCGSTQHKIGQSYPRAIPSMAASSCLAKIFGSCWGKGRHGGRGAQHPTPAGRTHHGQTPTRRPASASDLLRRRCRRFMRGTPRSLPPTSPDSRVHNGSPTCQAARIHSAHPMYCVPIPVAIKAGLRSPDVSAAREWQQATGNTTPTSTGSQARLMLGWRAEGSHATRKFGPGFPGSR